MTTKSVEYAFEADFRDLNKGVKDLVSGLKEISQAFKDLGKRVDDGLNGVGSGMDEAAKKAQKLKQTMNEGLGALKETIVGVGVAMTGLAVGIQNVVSTFGAFESQILQFGAVSSATAAQLDTFKNVAKDIGASTRFTAEQAAQAGVELAKMGFSADESSQALGGMIDASVAMGESLETTSQVISAAVRQFGLAASDAGKVGDIIVGAANKSAIGVKDFGDSMRYLGSAANASNQSIEDMAAALVILGNAGIKSTVAGNGLQNSLLRLQAPTKKGAALIKKYGLEIEDAATGKMRPFLDILEDLKKSMAGVKDVKKAADLKEIFGEVALNSIQVFFNTASEKIAETREEMHKLDGTAKTTADRMRRGVTQAMLEFKSAIEGAKIELGEKLAPAFTDFLKAITEGINKFKALSDPMKETIAKGSLIVLGLGTLAVAFGTLGLAMGKIIKNYVLMGKAATAYIAKNAAVEASNLTTATTFKGLGVAAKGVLAQYGLLAGAIGVIVIAGVKLIQEIEKWNKAQEAYDKDLTRYIKTVDEYSGSLARAIRMGDKALDAAKARQAAISSMNLAAKMREDMDELERSFKFMNEMQRKSELTGSRPALIAADKERQRLAKLGIKTEEDLNRVLAQRQKRLDGLNEKRDHYIKLTEKLKTEEEKLNEEKDKAPPPPPEFDEDAGKKRLKQIDKVLDGQLAIIKTQETQLENERKLAEAKKDSHIQDELRGKAPTTSEYGWRVHPVWGTRRLHTGTDYGISQGTPVKADADARVAFSGPTGGYGNVVVLDVGGGNFILYAHNSKLYKKVGDAVKKGEVISASGGAKGTPGAGTSTGPHLHKEFRKGGVEGTTNFNQIGVPYDTREGMHGSGFGHLNEIHEKENDLLLKKYKAYMTAYSAARAYFGESSKEAQDYLAKALEIEGKITDSNVNFAKEKAKAEEKAQKIIAELFEQRIEAMTDGYSKVANSAADLSKDIKNEIAKLNEAINSGDLPNDKFNVKLTEFLDKRESVGENLDLAKDKVKQYGEAIRSLEDELANKDISDKDRAKLQERLTKLTQDHGKALNDQRQVEESMGDLSKTQNEYLKALNKEGYSELLTKVTKSKDSLKDFSNEAKKNPELLKQMGKELGLSAEQMARLEGVIKEGEYFQQMDDQAKANTAALNNMVGILYTIGQAARAVGETFSGLGEGFVNFTRGVEDYAGGMASAVNRLLSGDVVGAVIQGGQTYVQGVTGFFEGISRSMGLMTAEDIQNGQAFIESMAKKSAENIAKQRKEQAKKAAEWELKTQKKAWSELAQAAKEHNEFLIEQHEQRLEKQQRLEDYFSGQQGAAQIDRETADFMNLNNVSAADRELIEPIVRKAIEARAGIITEVLKAYSGNITQAQDEIQRRLLDWAIETGEEVSKALAGDPKQVMDARVNALRAARERLYKQDIKQYEEAIKSEQKKLDLINAQIKADEKRISQREEERRKELAQFDAQDKGLFAQLVSGVDYNAAVRAGLADIANPEGVPTGTFSNQSIEEAIKERVALMTLENENKYKLEEIAQQEYLKQQQAIAALQARAAQEALKSEGLTNRQRLELEQMKADAYVSFQEAYRNALNERFDTEIQGIEKTIDANKRQAEAVSEAVEIQQGHIDALTETYNADLAHITSKIDEVIKGNEDWVVSAQELSDGVEGPLKKIIDLYNKATRVAGSLSSSGSSGSAASSMYVGTTANQGSSSVTTTSGQSFRTTSEAIAAGAMAQGGIVPDGYPNDSFLARLTSKEMVLPPSIAQFIMNAAKQATGGMRIGNIYITGDVNNPSQLRKVIIETLDAYNRRGAGNYYGTTGLL